MAGNKSEEASAGAGSEDCLVDGTVADATAGPRRGPTLRETAPPTTVAEILDRRQRGGYLKAVIIETDYDEQKKPAYTCYLLLSWCNGYRVLHVNWPARPRQFRDLDRLVGLVRRDFGYGDTIALRLAGGNPGRAEKRFRAF